jgi:hypothetical protein
MTEDELEGKFVVGKMFERHRTELTDDLRALIRQREAAL